MLFWRLLKASFVYIGFAGKQFAKRYLDKCQIIRHHFIIILSSIFLINFINFISCSCAIFTLCKLIVQQVSAYFYVYIHYSLMMSRITFTAWVPNSDGFLYEKICCFGLGEGAIITSIEQAFSDHKVTLYGNWTTLFWILQYLSF